MAARGGDGDGQMGEGDLLPRLCPARQIEEPLSMHIISRAGVGGGAMLLQTDGGQLHMAFPGLAGQRKRHIRRRHGENLWRGQGSGGRKRRQQGQRIQQPPPEGIRARHGTLPIEEIVQIRIV